MAPVTAQQLRDTARAAMLKAGGRGFVRFPERGALLVSDALRRCEDESARAALLDAMASAGFDCREEDGLLLLTPADDVLSGIACSCPCAVDWDSPRCSAQALAARWLGKARKPLTPAGRQLIIDALRLTWQDRMMDGLPALRAQAALMQRNADTSGFREAGAVIWNWCAMQEGKEDED
ncbi:MAG: hypothetical protein E7321_00270 [Clostridiales bacterium]|nr:hypothetical protein [Clostridiales bacterium]